MVINVLELGVVVFIIIAVVNVWIMFGIKDECVAAVKELIGLIGKCKGDI